KAQLRSRLGAAAERWWSAEPEPPEASAEALPAYFSCPPWQQAPLELPAFHELALPTEPARMDFFQPSVKREHPPLPYIHDRPPLSTERDEKVMEWIQRHAGCLLSYLDHLSQPKALEIWNTAPMSFWNPYGKDIP